MAPEPGSSGVDVQGCFDAPLEAWRQADIQKVEINFELESIVTRNQIAYVNLSYEWRTGWRKLESLSLLSILERCHLEE